MNLLQTVVETLLFYHPAVWWLSRRICIEREYCADDAATEICQDKESYAKALVTLAESAMSTPRAVTASTGGALTHRIKRLLGLARDRERLIPRPAGAAALAGLGLAVICCFLASPQTIAQPREEPRMIVTPIDELAKKLPRSTDTMGWEWLPSGHQMLYAC